MHKKPLIIGYIDKSYPYKRNIINISPQHQYIQVRSFNDLFKLFLLIGRRLHVKFSWYKIRKYFYLFVDFNLNHRLRKVDLFHFFNVINQGKTPWVVTFEGTLPIYHVIDDPEFINIDHPKKVKKALTYLAQPTCLRVIAMSHYAELLQHKLLEHFPEEQAAILPKLSVCYPPQPLLIKTLSKKELSDTTFSFIFVGRHFYRKGGYEIVKAFEHLVKEEHLPLRLTIVGNLDVNASPNVGHSIIQQREIESVSADSDWIEHYTELSNQDLIQKMKNSHVGLLPTYSDTFGYSVLEMQACGCPVITTDVQALPEINNKDAGWLINVPKTELQHALYRSKSEQAKLSQLIQDSLETIITDIVKNPSQIKQKAQYALDKLEDQHSPEKYRQMLESIYDESCQL